MKFMIFKENFMKTLSNALYKMSSKNDSIKITCIYTN